MPRKKADVDKAKKPKPVRDVPQTAQEIIDPTVRVGEDTISRYSMETPAAALMARVGAAYVKICAHKNAQNVAASMLRLYRKAGSRRKSLWPAVPVKDRRRLSYLRSPMLGKVAQYASGADDIEEVLDDPALALVNRPNPWQDLTEFVHLLAYSLDLAGNAYLYTPEANGGGTDFLMALQPQFTRVVASRTEFIAGYMYGRERIREVFLDRTRVAHAKLWPSIENPYLGEGSLHTIVRQTDFINLSDDAELARIMNGCRPDLILKMPKEASNDEIKIAEAKIRAKHRGPNKTGEMHVFRDVEVTAAGFTPRDMEWQAKRDECLRTIWAAFGIPETVFRLNDANLASSKVGHRQYMEQTIVPRQKIIAELLTMRVLPLFGVEPGEMWFAFDNPVKEDREEDMRVHTAYVAGGILSVNEARAELGYESVEEGDDLRVNGVPLALIGQPMPASQFGADPEAKPEAEQEDAEDEAPEEADALEETEDAPEDDAEQPEAKALESVSTKAKPEVVFLSKYLSGSPCCTHTKDDKNPPQSEETKRVLRLAAQMRQNLDPAIRSLIDGMLSQIENNPRPEATAEAVNRLRSVLETELVRVAAEGVTRGMARIGQTLSPESDIFDVVPVNALDHYSTYSIRLAGDISRTVQDQIQTAVQNGLAEGKTMREIKADVQAIAPDITDARAEAIARTETSRALNMGERLAWQKSGVQFKSWSQSGDTCPFCEAIVNANPGPHPIADPYLPLGGSIVGTDGKVYIADYEPIYGPPAHPNCECSLVPELDEPTTEAGNG